MQPLRDHEIPFDVLAIQEHRLPKPLWAGAQAKLPRHLRATGSGAIVTDKQGHSFGVGFV
jgi:hypothetical protein